jgi:DinB superfamily
VWPVLEIVFPSYEFSLTYARKLVEDVPDEQMCAQPVPGRVMNHAAFILGHLAWAGDNGVARLGGTPARADWKELFGMGAQPLAERSRYPSKAALLEALADTHARLTAAAAAATPETLAQPAPERMRSRFPTVGHLMVGLMTSHESSHLGQLSAWRRALGWPSVF